MASSVTPCAACGRLCDSRAQICPGCGEAIAPTVEGPRGQPRRLGRFEILREVARGGIGVVYEARDPDLERRVALKILRDGDDEKLHTRFHREASVAASLSHPNIIPVHEVGLVSSPDSAAPVRYIVMEFIEGDTLNEALVRWSLEENIRALEQIAEAIGHAHDAGVFHRDLKPANVLINLEGRPIVTDFGLAGLVDGTRLTRTGDMLGTTHYMAPEQVLGLTKEMDARTDVWALGVILYEMLSGGKRPFAAPDAAAVFHRILNVDPPVPLRSGQRAPWDLETICFKALEKERPRRYPDGHAFAQELRRWQTGESIHARPPSALTLFTRTIRRNPWWTAGGLGVLLTLLATFGSLALRERQRALDREQAAHKQSERHLRLFEKLRPLSRRIEETRAHFYLPQIDILRKLKEVESTLEELDKLSEDPTGARRPEVWTALAKGWFFIGRTRKAEAAFKTAEALAPQDGQIAYYLSRIYLERAMIDLLTQRSPEYKKRARTWTDKAREYVTRDLGRDTSQLDRDLAPAYRAYASNNTQELLRLCQTGIERYAGQLGVEDFWMLLGCARTQPAERLAAWDKGVEQRPHSAWLLLLRGSAYHDLRRYEEALADHERAVKINQNLGVAWANMGLIRRKLGDTRAALADYDRAISIDPLVATTYLNRGVARRASGNLKGAIEDYNRCLELFPKFPKAYCNRGVAHKELRKWKAALDDQTLAISLEPGYAMAYNNRGTVYLAMRRLDAARADFDRAIEANANYAEAYTNRASVRQDQRDYNGALRDLNQAIKIAPRLAPAYVNRGNLRQALGRKKSAMEDFDQAIGIDPDLLDAYLNRCALRLANGNTVGALADCDKAIKLNPKNAPARINRGTIRRAIGRLDAAITDFEQAVKLDRNSWQAWAGYGLVLQEKGQGTAARKAWAAALRCAPPKIGKTIRKWIDARGGAKGK